MHLSIPLLTTSLLAYLSATLASPILETRQSQQLPFKFTYLFSGEAGFGQIAGPITLPLGGNQYVAPITNGTFHGPALNGSITAGAASKTYSDDRTYEHTTFTLSGFTHNGTSIGVQGDAVTSVGVHQSLLNVDINSTAPAWVNITKGFVIAYTPTAADEKTFTFDAYSVSDTIDGGGVV